MKPSLRASWDRAWKAVAARGDGSLLAQKLLDQYAQPERVYHSVQHLGECIRHFHQAEQLAHRAGEVEMALWFHDAIYELSASDNESKSADWAMAELLAAGVATEAAQRIHGLVLITGHAAMPVTQDERLVVDIDLSILGAPPARFAEYEAQVRREYAWVPEPEFRDKREALLASFLARRSIYATNHFQERFEAQARRNLIGSIETLRGSQETP